MNFFSGYLTSASSGKLPSPSRNLKKSSCPGTRSHRFCFCSAILSAQASGETRFSLKISLCSLHFLLISSRMPSRYARYLSCLFLSFMSLCFFSYFFVNTGHNTVPNNMLTDISNVGKACVISPPFEITLFSVRSPVLSEVIPIVIDGPSISAKGTVSCFRSCGGGSILISACSISRWNLGDRKKNVFSGISDSSFLSTASCGLYDFRLLDVICKRLSGLFIARKLLPTIIFNPII